MSLKKLADGIAILAKYYDIDDPCDCGADHDIIFGPSIEWTEEDFEKDEVIDRKVSDEDRKKLAELGWGIDGLRWARNL